MKMFRSLVLLAAALAAAHAAHAVTYINDLFNSSPYTSGTLGGQDGWAGISGNGTNNIQITSGNVVLTTSGQDVQQPFIGGNISTSGLTSLYTTANFTITSAQTGDYFLHLGIFTNTSNFYQRLFVKAGSVGGTFDLGVLAVSGNTSPVSYGADLPLNAPLTVVVAWDFVAGATNDTFSLYVNPTDVRANDTAYSTATWGSPTAEPTTLGSVDFRQGSAASAAGVQVSSVSVSDTFPVTGSVPEPSAFAALFGASAIGLAAWRRSRRQA